MKYIFKNKTTKGEYPISQFHVAWYEMENGYCFDEMFFDKDTFDPFELLTFIETEENENDQDRTRVFVEMKNGSLYEFKLEKIKHPEDCNNFYGGR
jgi:hypothetical protein